MQTEGRKGDRKKKKSWDEFSAWSCSLNSGEKDPLETVGNYSTISWVFSLIKRNIQSLLPWMLISIFPASHCATDTVDLWPPVMSRWFKPRLSCEQGFCKIKRNVQIPSSILLSCHGLGEVQNSAVSLGQIFQLQPSHQTDTSVDL